MDKQYIQPDYAKLQITLANLYQREVSLEEATRTGNCLVGIYDVLLSEYFNGGKIEADTTNL